MDQDVVGRYYERLIRDCYLLPVLSDKPGRHYRISRRCGTGGMRRITLGDGLDVNYWTGLSIGMMLDDSGVEPDILEISCCLKGSLQVGLYEPDEEYEMTPGQVMFYYHKNILPSYRVNACGYSGFSIHVHHDYLARWLAPECACLLDEDWRRSIGRLLRNRRLLVSNAPLALLRLAEEIQEGPAGNMTTYLAFQAKVLNFLSGSLQVRQEKPVGGMSSQDLNLVNRTRQYLLENLYQPPGIAELARIFHTNSWKLKRSFKQAYQTTIYGFIKEQRLEQSRKLLKHTDLSIADIASEIGYANPSKYATAFKLHTGMTPSEYKRNGLQV